MRSQGELKDGPSLLGNIPRFSKQILVNEAVATNISANNLNVVKHFLLVIENILLRLRENILCF